MLSYIFGGSPKKLFPSKWSFIIFVSYMGLFINQGLLITASRREGSYPYNPSHTILASEFLKLVLSLLFTGASIGPLSLLRSAIENKGLLLYYLLPSFLYALYNNLTFYNLSLFDPTSYFILLQIRLLLTGFIYQVFFKKYLSRRQWLSLALLTLGCMIQRSRDLSPAHTLSSLLQNHTDLLFILLQAFCSVFAGVYNEYIIKSSNVDLSLQNVYMYIDSILSNLLFILLSPNPSPKTSLNSLFESIYQGRIALWIILNNALIGLVTSLFLKNLNSILKAFASALEIIFTALLGQVLLGIHIERNTLIAIGIVSLSLVIYVRNPVASPDQQKGKPSSSTESV